MLSLIFAAIILPGALGCCFPDSYSGSTYVVEQNVLSTFVVDYTQKKFILRPAAGPVEFVLNDFGNSKVYTKSKDGKCTKADMTNANLYSKCMPTTGRSGDATLGPMGALPITSRAFKVGGRNVVIAATKSNCLPVVTVGTGAGMTRTTIFANTTTMNVNVADLNQDISGCV